MAPRFSPGGHLLFTAIYPYFGLLLTVVVSGGALWQGDREEQIAAGGVLMSWAITVALRDRSWIGTQWAAFGADVGLLVLVTAIALRTPRYWPLVAAAFQLICVLIHVARIVDPSVHAWAYATGQVIFTQLYIWAVGFGVFNTWRARRQFARTADPMAAPGATRR